MNECGFCSTVLISVAEGLGTEEGLVRRLLDDPEVMAAPERMRPVLRYVRKLTERPAAVGQADVDAILAAGWDESAVVYANLTCEAFNLFNRWVKGLGVDADPKYVKATIRQLIDGSYPGVNDMVERINARKAKPPYRAAEG